MEVKRADRKDSRTVFFIDLGYPQLKIRRSV